MKPVLLAAVFAVMAIPGAGEARVWTVGGGSADFPLIAPAIAPRRTATRSASVAASIARTSSSTSGSSLVGEGRPTLFGTGLGIVIDVRADELSGFD